MHTYSNTCVRACSVWASTHRTIRYSNLAVGCLFPIQYKLQLIWTALCKKNLVKSDVIYLMYDGIIQRHIQLIVFGRNILMNQPMHCPIFNGELKWYEI